MKKAIIIIVSVVSLIIYNKEIESFYKSVIDDPTEVLGTYYGPEDIVEIKGETTCIVHQKFGEGFSSWPTSYVRDGDQIRVERVGLQFKGLLFTIKDEGTLIEVGGDVYRKEQNNF